MNTSRRDTLRILGAAGAVAAVPAASAQEHQHPVLAPPAPAPPYTPVFFTPEEYRTIGALADLIIPATDTPGASAAGVPAYIDDSIAKNPKVQSLFRDNLKQLDAMAGPKAKSFAALKPSSQAALITPWSKAADSNDLATPGAQFFKAFKNLTCDGYYTSYEGLVTELGYQGNVALATFPGCDGDHKH